MLGRSGLLYHREVHASMRCKEGGCDGRVIVSLPKEDSSGRYDHYCTEHAGKGFTRRHSGILDNVRRHNDATLQLLERLGLA